MNGWLPMLNFLGNYVPLPPVVGRKSDGLRGGRRFGAPLSLPVPLWLPIGSILGYNAICAVS
jgi:hypothetical protein